MQSLRRQIAYWFWPCFLTAGMALLNAVGFRQSPMVTSFGFPFEFMATTEGVAQNVETTNLLLNIAITGTLFLVAWEISAWRCKAEPIASNFTSH